MAWGQTKESRQWEVQLRHSSQGSSWIATYSKTAVVLQQAKQDEDAWILTWIFILLQPFSTSRASSPCLFCPRNFQWSGIPASAKRKLPFLQLSAVERSEEDNCIPTKYSTSSFADASGPVLPHGSTGFTSSLIIHKSIQKLIQAQDVNLSCQSVASWKPARKQTNICQHLWQHRGRMPGTRVRPRPRPPCPLGWVRPAPSAKLRSSVCKGPELRGPGRGKTSRPRAKHRPLRQCLHFLV